MGGRTAEEIVYGTRTTGAENDIEQATDLARRMVTRWGMSEKLGTVQLAPRENAFLGGGGYPSEKPFSKETARTIDEEVLRIIDESHEEARRLLTKHRKEPSMPGGRTGRQGDYLPTRRTLILRQEREAE